MQRRILLTMGGTVLATALAGCSSSDSDPRSDFHTAVADTLEDSGEVNLDYADWQDDVFSIEHTTTASDRQELMPELMAVTGTFAGAYDAHQPDMRKFEGWAYDSSNDPIGSYYIRPEWGQAYNDGEISGDEYNNRVAETFS